MQRYRVEWSCESQRRLHARFASRRENMNSNNSQRFQINNQLMWVVLLVAMFSPVFFGSNRPVFWLMWALFLSITAAWWFARMAVSNAVLRIPLRNVRWMAAGFGLFAAYMLVQILPLGSLAADVYSTADPSIAIKTNTISLAPGNTVLAFDALAILRCHLLFHPTGLRQQRAGKVDDEPPVLDCRDPRKHWPFASISNRRYDFWYREMGLSWVLRLAGSSIVTRSQHFWRSAVFLVRYN